MKGRATSIAPSEERLLDVREAASRLGISPKTLYQWAYERRIPTVKLFGHALRFKLSTILKLIEDSEQPALKSLSEGKPLDISVT
jgi:excisionase family DNA binding protein